MGKRITKEELLSEIRRLHDSHGKVTAKIMRNDGEYSPSIYQRRFDSWNRALKTAEVGANNKQKYTDEELLEELHRLHDELGRAPHNDEMADLSKYGANTFGHRFGSWNEALEKAGLEPDVGGSKITDTDLLDELKRLENEFGHTPSVNEMDDNGKYGTTTYTSRFGSWSDALEKAGLEPPQKRIQTRDLLSELQRLNQELDHVPRREDMNEYGEYSEGPYYDRFGNWTNALKEAGITPDVHRNITQDDLIEEIQAIAIKLDRAPFRKEVADQGKYAEATYWRYFESWAEAVRQAGYEPALERDIPDEDLISALQQFACEFDGSPTREEMDDHGPYSASTYARRFGSWTTALEKAGLEPNAHYNASDKELLNELRRLDGEYSEVTTEVMTEKGKYGIGTYTRRFGSWNTALIDAGLQPVHERNIPKEDLASALTDLAERLGRAPTASEMNESGRYTVQPYRETFGSWNKALHTAKLEPHVRTDIASEELIDELLSVDEKLNRSPQMEDMDDLGEFHSSTYVNRFGSWNAALQTAGLDINRRNSIPREDLINEVQRVAEDLDRSPTKDEFSVHGRYSVGPYNRRFDGWAAVLQEAGYEPNRYVDVTETELKAEIDRLYELNDQTPTVEMMTTNGKFSVYAYYDVFDSWVDALEDCGFTPRTGGIEYTEKELFNELHRLASKLGRPPTTAEMAQDGKYGIGAFQRHFGTWNNALQAAGYDPHVLIDIPESDLIDELERVHNRLGRSPTRVEFVEIAAYSTQPYKDTFGSWNEALREAGLPVVKRQSVPKAELIEELQRVAGKLDESPSIAQMKTHGKYYPTLYTKRFGTWNQALGSADLEPTPPQRAISRDELTKNLENVIEQFEGVPTKEEFRSHSEYSEGPYNRVFGGYNDALRQLGYEPRHPRDGDGDYRYYGPNWPQQRERRIELDKEKCRKCNQTRGTQYKKYGRDLHVHHIVKFTQFESYKSANRLTNLITLCQDCHPQLEGKPKQAFIPLAPPRSLTTNSSEPDEFEYRAGENYTLDKYF